MEPIEIGNFMQEVLVVQVEDVFCLSTLPNISYRPERISFLLSISTPPPRPRPRLHIFQHLTKKKPFESIFNIKKKKNLINFDCGVGRATMCL